MTFLILILVLSGLALIFAGIENKSIPDYLRTWVGTTSNASK